MSKSPASWTKPDYGIDAPVPFRNISLIGILCVLLALFTPKVWHLASVDFELHRMFAVMGTVLLTEAALFLLYFKYGKHKHRDFMLAMHCWRGDEQVLDVGCGRGLLLAGAAKKLTTGHATGIDIWSNVDMAANSEPATLRNLELEGITSRCTLVSAPAQQMPFADATFDVIVSNLCIHNIYDKPTRQRAIAEVARVLRPGGLVLLSDFKLTAQYAAQFAEMGFQVERRWGNLITTFPPLRVVVARKPL